MAPRPLGLETTLVAACLRPLAAPGRIDAVRAAAEGAVDWARVVALARRHRVEGFVVQALADAGVAPPSALAGTLAARAARARLQALVNAGEEARVGAAFAAAGIDALFVKGATTAMRVHGRIGLKSSWDVDVLVARERMDAAGAVLAGLGYRLSVLGGVEDPVRVRRFLDAHKEAEWRHAGRGVTVELHTELSDNRVAIAAIGLGSPRQTVALMPGVELATLATPPLFAYLAYHGTVHLWERLKWIADVAALLHGRDVATLHAQAVALGAGRTPGVAILLAHELLGLEMPAGLLATLRRDRATRRLLRFSYAAIAAERVGEGRPFGAMVASTRAYAWLVPGIGHRWGAIRSFLTRPYRPAHLAVPRWAVPAVILAMLPARLLTRMLNLRRPHQTDGKVASKP